VADSPSRLTTWCRLLRLPNLFTVPGDPLAGYLLAAGATPHWWATAHMPLWRAVAASATSLLLYAAGLLLNDYFDRDVDAKERPDRPIPSGAVSARMVLIVGALLLIGGVLMARWIGGRTPGTVAAALAAAVLAYNAGLKKARFGGPVVMGLCRAGSVLVGAAFAADIYGKPQVLVAAGAAWLYTASITFLAAGETSGKRPGWVVHIPGLILLAGGIAMLRCSMGHIKWPLMFCVYWDGPLGGGTNWFVDWAGVVAVGLLALAVVETEFVAARVRRGHLPTPAFIGRLIRAMITVQAAWCAWTCGELLGHGLCWPWSALLIVALTWLVVRCGAGVAARRFYGS